MTHDEYLSLPKDESMQTDRQPRTLDVGAYNYSFRPREDGQVGSFACWTPPLGGRPSEGDFLILRNGQRTTRYRIESLGHCMHADPPTMWMAELRFAPRAA